MRKKNERGALVVEASIVFPVMFLVIFVMIYTGNAYLQKSRVESIVAQCAIDGASYCADPQLQQVEGGELPTLDNIHIYPYRYIIKGQVNSIEVEMEELITQRVSNMGSGMFRGMEPLDFDVDAEFDSNFLYATFAVDASYKIEMPIRLLGMTENMSLKVNTHVEMPVSDSVEMIRTVDMVWDYMERLGVAEEIEAAKSKLQTAMDKVNKWFEG